jgi:invasion protein IalB
MAGRIVCSHVGCAPVCALATVVVLAASATIVQAQSPSPQDAIVAYTSWTKFCGKEQTQAGRKEVCVTVKEARGLSGQVLAGAALYETEGETTRLLRITLPNGVQLPQGARVVIDTDEPINAPFLKCETAGCMAQAQVDPDFVTRLKQGKYLVLEGIDASGHLATYLIPLIGFAQANEGPPTDPLRVKAEPGKHWPERNDQLIRCGDTVGAAACAWQRFRERDR